MQEEPVNDPRKKPPENDAEFTIYLKTALKVLAEDDADDHEGFEKTLQVDYEGGATEFRVTWEGRVYNINVTEI